MASKPRCKVVFRRSGVGPEAILMWNGHSLNAINYPRGARITVAGARRAKATLMRGCAELVRDYRKHARRR